MFKLLWAERQKMRRSKIVWIAVFATVMAAVIVFAAGQEVYYGSETVYYGSRYVDHAGWFMNVGQSLSTYFVLPAVIALVGSYMICREEQEDTLKQLRLIPVNETKLTAAKMIIAFFFSILLYLLLFAVTFLTEAVLHFSDLPKGMVWGFLKEYLLDGAGIFFAVSPLVALVSRWKKGYWLVLVFTEIYSVGGLLAGMSKISAAIYPVMAVFNFSGHTAAAGKLWSLAILLLCGCISVFILKGLNRSESNS